MTAQGRRRRTAAADALCVKAYDAEGGPFAGVALVAVGGYGRAELAPHSDLDLVLVHDEDVGLAGLGERLWYPLWDSGVRVDHAVRSLPQMAEQAAADVRVVLGLLDVRHVAGDPSLTLRLRTAVWGQWRRDARRRLPRLRELTRRRHDAVGELAHAAVPDLKEAAGGIRDTVVLASLASSRLVDVPSDLSPARQQLLDVRDVLHEVAGRPGDRIGPEAWGPLAAALGWPDEQAAQRRVRELGRRVTHLSRLAWRRADGEDLGPIGARGALRPGAGGG